MSEVASSGMGEIEISRSKVETSDMGEGEVGRSNFGGSELERVRWQ